MPFLHPPVQTPPEQKKRSVSNGAYEAQNSRKRIDYLMKNQSLSVLMISMS